MTLASFKYNIQVVSFIAIILLYTGVVFVAGRNSGTSTGEAAAGQTNSKTLSSAIESPQSREDSALSSKVLASFVKLCSNTALGFEVAYPRDWFTTYNTPQDQCKYFAPFSFVIPEGAQDEVTPLTIKIIPPNEWDTTIAFYENPSELYSVKSVENSQINGNLTRKIESVSTGESTLPRGFARVAYLIFDDQKPTVIVYNQLDNNDDLESMKKQADDMAASFKFF